MKKLILISLVSLLFIGCESSIEIEYSGMTNGIAILNGDNNDIIVQREIDNEFYGYVLSERALNGLRATTEFTITGDNVDYIIVKWYSTKGISKSKKIAIDNNINVKYVSY